MSFTRACTGHMSSTRVEQCVALLTTTALLGAFASCKFTRSFVSCGIQRQPQTLPRQHTHSFDVWSRSYVLVVAFELCSRGCMQCSEAHPVLSTVEELQLYTAEGLACVYLTAPW